MTCLMHLLHNILLILEQLIIVLIFSGSVAEGQGSEVCREAGELQVLQHGPGHPQCPRVLRLRHQESQLERGPGVVRAVTQL